MFFKFVKWRRVKISQVVKFDSIFWYFFFRGGGRVKEHHNSKLTFKDDV